MDALELLKEDHEKVAGLFEQIETDEDGANQEQLFAQIKQELDVHANAEEKVFYPRLKEIAEMRDITFEAIEEHQEIKNLLAELETMSADDDDWEDTISELRDTVEHHVEEEEGEMFPQVREILSQEEINQLGKQLEAEKQKQLKTSTAGR